jgi:hypothetical protein
MGLVILNLLGNVRTEKSVNSITNAAVIVSIKFARIGK